MSFEPVDTEVATPLPAPTRRDPGASVRAWCEDHPRDINALDVSRALKRPYAPVRDELARLARDGVIRRVAWAHSNGKRVQVYRLVA